MSKSILDDYEDEDTFAKAHGVSVKTIQRYRAGGLPFTRFGGRVYIHVPGARDWLESRVRKANPPRRSRAAAERP